MDALRRRIGFYAGTGTPAGVVLADRPRMAHVWRAITAALDMEGPGAAATGVAVPSMSLAVLASSGTTAVSLRSEHLKLQTSDPL